MNPSSQSKQFSNIFPTLEVVLGKIDRRTKVTEDLLEKFPFNAIGWIVSKQKFSNNEGQKGTKGTAFLIQSNLALTSCHNFFVCDKDTFRLKEYVPISFTLMQPGPSKFVPKSSPIDTLIPNQNFKIIMDKISILRNLLSKEKDQTFKKEYIHKIQILNQEATQNDFALLKLTETFNKQPYFKLFQGLKSQIPITVTGYIHVYGNEFCLLTHSNSYDSISKGHIYYDIDTTQGQSGSPVYIQEDRCRVVAIHRAYDPKKKRNFATLITDQIINTVNLWIQQISIPIKVGEQIELSIKFIYSNYIIFYYISRKAEK